MSAELLNIEIRFAWWWKWYVLGVTVMCLATGSEPDTVKSQYWAAKAKRVWLNGKRIKSE
jgi:hypothetical protein